MERDRRECPERLEIAERALREIAHRRLQVVRGNPIKAYAEVCQIAVQALDDLRVEAFDREFVPDCDEEGL